MRTLRTCARFSRTACAVGAVILLGVGCSGAASTDAFSFDDVALFAGLDTRAVLIAQEEQVAVCMAAEGFEYIPYVPRNAGSYPAPGTLAALPDADYVAELGFGFADRVRLQWAAESDDPNPSIVEAMSPDQRTEYFRSLHADSATDGSSPVGCQSSGLDADYIEAVQGVSQLRFEAVERMEVDERYIKIMVGWSRCMAAEGFDFAERRLAVLAYFGPMIDNATVSRDEGAVQDLAGEEMLVAQADLTCIEPHKASLGEIAAGYEKGLVGEAQAYLEYLAALATTYGARPNP